MKTWFSISELARAQGISRQTLIHYDRTGVFHPERTDPETGYRWYSSDQLDELDTIILLKTIGLSLDEIKHEMKNYSTSSALETLEGRIRDTDRKIASLKALRDRLSGRLESIREASSHSSGEIVHAHRPRQHLYTFPVKAPYTLPLVSLATKECLKRAREEEVDVDFLSGAILPYEKLTEGLYLETTEVFFPTRKPGGRHTVTLPEGDTVSIYHRGQYSRTPESYERLISWCIDNSLEIISPAYEFALNDYLTTKDTGEFMTRITVFVRPSGT